MPAKLLLVEDDNQIREIVVDYFNAKSEGSMVITTASDGQKGLELIESDTYDLVMLDIMLPHIDGFSLCRRIRKTKDTPILFLTARTSEEDMLYGYELGCDDYIRKPFSLAELYAKVSALLKRAQGTVSKAELNCGDIILNPVTLSVKVKGEDIELAPKEFEILAYLMNHKNWVISRDTLLDRIWGEDYFGSGRVFDNHVKKLRRALGEAGEQIKTVISKGYKISETGGDTDEQTNR